MLSNTFLFLIEFVTDRPLQWLTKGRNSCPLCRGQGVDEKDKGPTSAAPTSGDTPAASAATSSNASFVDAASVAT